MCAGQLKTGLCAVPSNGNNRRSGSCSFPTAEATYGLQHLPAELRVAERDGVCQDGRAVYEVEEKPLLLLSDVPGSRGCKSPAFHKRLMTQGSSEHKHRLPQDFPSLPLHAMILQAKQTSRLLQSFRHFCFCLGVKFRWSQLNLAPRPFCRP